MLLATAHKLTALFVVALLLLLQYAPLTVLVARDDASRPYCLRDPKGAHTKCPHHTASHAAPPDAEPHHAPQAAAPTPVSHRAHAGRHTLAKASPAASGFLSCGCDAHGPTAPAVLAVSKMVVRRTSRLTPILPQRWRFVAFKTAKPDRFALDLFHPPRTHV